MHTEEEDAEKEKSLNERFRIHLSPVNMLARDKKGDNLGDNQVAIKTPCPQCEFT